MRSAFFATTAFVLILASACSSSDSTPSSTAVDPAALDAACTDFANAVCTKLGTCGAEALARRYPDQATCVSRQKAQCTNTTLAPDTGRTVDGIKACTAAYPATACVDVLTGVTPVACQPSAHPGKRAVGQPCAFNAQCSTAQCNVLRGAACGTCAATAPKAGDPCPLSCGPQLYCNTTTNVCTAYATAGQPCDATTACLPGLGCVGSTTTAKGACVASATTVSAACDTSVATGVPCAVDEGLVCQTKQCVKYVAATTGQACGPTKPTSSVCVGGSKCNNDPGVTGTCQGPAADGAACSTGDDQGCLPTADCVGSATGANVQGTCTVRTATACK
jgi:hypothetical protein